MKYNSLSYYAFLDIERSPGIFNKINDTVRSSEELNFKSKAFFFKKNFSGLFCFFRSLIEDESDLIFIRFSDLVFPFVFFLLVYLRFKNKKIIIDVPTPRCVAIKEFDSIKNPINKNVRKIISYISSFWVLYPANCIIQYADESLWFSIFIKHKILKMGNGIFINEDAQVSKKILASDGEINLVAVAQLARWHGYDRLLYAISEYNKINTTKYRIKLTIVGAGDELQSLKDLTRDLQLDCVTFTGRLTGDALDKAFKNKHVGVASLGLYRIGLREASVLKVREYMSRGLIVLASAKDPDFIDKNSFRIEVENSDEIQSIVEALFTLPERIFESDPDEILAYSKNKLSIKSKLKEIIRFIGC